MPNLTSIETGRDATPRRLIDADPVPTAGERHHFADCHEMVARAVHHFLEDEAASRWDQTRWGASAVYRSFP